MPRIPIEQLDDPRIAVYRHLKAHNQTRDSGLFVVEGEKLFDRLCESRYPVASVLVCDRHEPRIADRVPEGVPLYVVPHSAISVLVGFNFHRGVLACGARIPAASIDEIAQAAGRRLSLVVCPTLNNPENLGAIVRIGDVFGVDAILVGDSCPDPLSRRVLRVSMGTALRMPILIPDNLEQVVEHLRRDLGVEGIATVLDPDAEPLPSFRCPDRFALFLGSESEGLDPSWVARCDRRLTIPMRPGAESLNVAVAAGITLYHLSAAGMRT